MNINLKLKKILNNKIEKKKMKIKEKRVGNTNIKWKMKRKGHVLQYTYE